jgi:hypothetical protein
MKFLLPVLWVFMAACSTPEVVPEGLLERERFKETLMEAQLIEARMSQQLVVERATVIPAEHYYAEMFAKQGTTKEQFERTFEFYAARPIELKQIYEEIFTELSKRKDGLPQ